jgi:hypothetical protein
VNTYADGVYTSTSPLGPFSYSPDSPFSSVPGGFAPGAGHGSTVQDRFGNWWHVSTCRISVGHVFERRISIHPAGFGADGSLFCNQEFPDHPIVIPQRPADPWTDTTPGWRLLSIGRPATATSSLEGHSPASAVDEDIRTMWVAASCRSGERLAVDLGTGCIVAAVQVNLGDHDLSSRKLPETPDLTDDQFVRRELVSIDRPVAYVVETSADGERWAPFGAVDVDAPHRLFTAPAAVAARYVRVTGGPGAWEGPFAITGLRVFGERSGSAPTVARVTAVRLDERVAQLTWVGAEGADGVNVRYGRSPDRLVHSWLAYGRTSLVLGTLSAGVDYWVAVDAFNGSGVTRGEPVPVTR